MTNLGFGPRPFYIIGHNPNSIKEAINALDSGANAIEPDVNVYKDDKDQLCIDHGTISGKPAAHYRKGKPTAPPLTKFLKDLHNIAIKRPELALVLFDCKPEVAKSSKHGTTLLHAIRSLLTFDINLNVIISVAEQSQTAIFNKIKSDLKPREGLMIDGEKDPISVSKFFTKGRVTNQCFGSGISFMNFLLGPKYRSSIERACEFCAETNKIRFVNAWTVNNVLKKDMEEYINIGVDGIITDKIKKLHLIVKDTKFKHIIRLAKRSDNPFNPPNFAYGLSIHTGDKSGAGTDADVTFTLRGTKGTSSVTVNTGLYDRMERNNWNYVTLQSPDLGTLKSITVQRDNSGLGPNWYLDRILVKSFRYHVSKQAVFNRWIDTTSPFTYPLA